MKIAVTYDSGSVFPHFGHTEAFKVYEVEEGKVVSAQVVASEGSGHGALAGLLADQSVDVLICGGIGGGAQAALEEKGITLCSGASGDADAAVEAYIRGELSGSGANCSHHDEEHSCGEANTCAHHAEGGCAEHCGAHQIQGKNVGKVCRVHYEGTLNDGSKFDSSYDRGEPLEFVCGAGMMIVGFDAAVADMEVGEIRDVHLMPSEAYGEREPGNVFTAPIANVPGADELEAGQQVYLTNGAGQSFPVLVTAVENGMITFDANHELAGKELNFRIELVSSAE